MVLFVLALLLVLLVAVASASGSASWVQCKKGQPCGRSCIAWDKTCHQ